MLLLMDAALLNLFTLLLTFPLTYALPIDPPPQVVLQQTPPSDHTQVLILGGGVAGVIAARTLQQAGISDFIIVEARHELGGRMMSHTFGTSDHEYTVEMGANWVQGTREDDGPENPIWALVKKHGIQM